MKLSTKTFIVIFIVAGLCTIMLYGYVVPDIIGMHYELAWFILLWAPIAAQWITLTLFYAYCMGDGG